MSHGNKVELTICIQLVEAITIPEYGCNCVNNVLKFLSICQIMSWQELQYLIKCRLVNSEMFTVSMNTGNFKFVGILGNGVCAQRRVCIDDTDYLKNAKDGQERVYHSMHMPL